MTNEELIADLQKRKQDLEAEMNRVSQQAATQAALPYQSAIGEIDRTLAIIQQQTGQ